MMMETLTTQNINLDRPNFACATQAKPITKQLRYYYNHKPQRLNYQSNYYTNHKSIILQQRNYNYHNNPNSIKVKRTNNNIRVIRNIKYISNNVNCQITKDKMSKFKHDNANRLKEEIFYHTHGRPRVKERVYDLWNKGRLEFHLIPEINFKQVNPKRFEIWFGKPLEGFTNAKQLTVMTAHMLGLKYGDSIVYKDEYNHKVSICFDRSGLDIGSSQGLIRLVECHTETGLKGSDLLCYFASHYSFNGYIQAYRGNKLLVSSELTNMIKDYAKITPPLLRSIDFLYLANLKQKAYARSVEPA